MNGQKELQETVSFLKMMISCYEKKSTPRNPYKATLYSLNIALQCAEKQIAKKPIYSDFDDNGYEEIIPYKAVCPTCGYEFEFGTWNDEQNHHCDCGQKLDWSEV